MNHFVPSVLASVVLAASGMAYGEALQVLTTDVPPMAFVKDGKLQGFCIDIVAELQRRLGHSDPIVTLPWARAYHKAQTEPLTMLVCPKRSAEREHLFQWVGPLRTSHTSVYVKAGGQSRLAGLEEAKRLSSILVVRASYSAQDLAARGFQNLYEVNDASSMVRMLLADRAPAMVLEPQELDAVLGADAAARQALVSAYAMRSPTSNLAFSRDVPAATVRAWQAAFEAMKADGSYGKINERWFPSAQRKR